MNVNGIRTIQLIVVGLAILVVAGIIFCFSSQTGETSGYLSSEITQKLLRTIYPEYELLTVSQRADVFQRAHLLVRKLAHYSEYLIFGSLLMVWFFLLLPEAFLFGSILRAFFLGVLYSAADEWHQSFVRGRGPALLDVGIDSLGVLTGVVITATVVYVHCFRKKRIRAEDENTDCV